MATVKQFEDLLCWRKARELTSNTYKAFAPCSDRGLTDQIQRAAVSVMSNIAEGFESGTRQEFLNYLYIAKASAGEVRAQLYAAHDIGYVNIQTFKDLKSLAEECSRLLSSFIKSVKSSSLGGLQHKREKTKAQIARIQFDVKMLEDMRRLDPGNFEKYHKERYERLKRELDE